jgi:hypothetical protein
MRLEFSQHRRTACQPLVKAAGRVLVASLAFGAMSPAIDGISMVAAQEKKAGYSVQTDPFEANPEIRGLASAIMNMASSTKGRMETLFSMYSTSLQGGLKVVASDGRPPNTAAETIGKGGDCTEFAFVVLAVINAMNEKGAGIRAAAQEVHFRSSPPGKNHMIISVSTGNGKGIIVDLQAPEIGKTKNGGYDVILTLSPELAGAIYHQEYGDYLRDAGQLKLAIVAYEKSLEIYEGNSYAHQNLGILYEKAGNMKAAKENFNRANALAPGGYTKDAARGNYNAELQAGENAYNSGDWAACREHFTRALELGKRLKHGDSAIIIDYIKDCDARLK